MNPYDVLGVATDATLKQIKSAYRKLSAQHHPDKEGGDREKFEEVKLAYDVLSNPERRSRYDKTGRVDVSPITPERVQIFIDQTMSTVVQSMRPDGSSDDPVWDNIRDKIVLSITASLVPLKQQKNILEKQLRRTEQLLKRFKPKQEADPVGDALRKEKKRIEGELNHNQDATELANEAARVVQTYDYDVGPGPEGQYSPGPTSRPLLSGYGTRLHFHD